MKKVFVVLFYLSTWLAWAQTATVNFNNQHQIIDGFGGSSAWSGQLSPTVMSTLYKNGTNQLGFTIIRCRIDPNKSWTDEAANAKNAKALGATVFATPWTPPISMKTNNNVVGGELSTSSYGAYANYLNQFIDYVGTNNIDAISLQNEPDITVTYESCTWNGTQMHNFCLNNAGVIKKPVIMAESFNYNFALTDPTMNDPAAAKNVSYIGGHLYGSQPKNYTKALSLGKHVWMTEWYNSDVTSTGLVSYGKQILDCMYQNFSAYVYWWMTQSNGVISPTGTVNKNGYILAQFAKYVRPGYYRVDATYNPQSGVYVVAFTGNGNYVIVTVNNSTSSKTQQFTLQNGAVASVAKSTTSLSKSLSNDGNVAVTNGSFTSMLDAQSVTTFVGTTTSSNPIPVVSITAPTNSAVYTEGNNVTLSANATITTGNISKVDFYNGTTLLGTDASAPYTYTMNAATAGTYSITAIATSASNATTTSTAVTFQVLPAAPAVTATATYCQNVTATVLTATGTTLKWYTAATGGTGSTTAPTPATTNTGTTNYYVSQTKNGAESTRSMIAVTVNPAPAAPTTTAIQTYCQNGTAIALTATGTGLKWYTAATVGTGSTTAPTPSTTTAGTTNYYVSQTTTGCESARAMIAVTINALPLITQYSQVDGGAWNQTSSSTVCASSTIVLGPQPNVTTGWSWSGPSGYSATTREITLTALAVNKSGNYTATYTDGNSCKAIGVYALTVNAAPSAPTVTAIQTYCQNGTATALTATGTGLLWYTAATGGTGSTTAPTPSTATTGTTNYYVSQTTTGCESARAMIAVMVTNTATASITTTSPTAFCSGGSVTLTASVGTSYKWFNGSTQVGTAATYSATTAGSYTVEVTNGGNCKATSSATNVTVNASPSAPTVTATQTYCQNGTATALTATGTGLLWYTSATGGTGSTTAPTPSTAITGATNYYVSQTTTGCESSRSMIAVTVTNTATASITTTSPTVFCTGGSVTLTASAGTSYKWFNGSTQVGTAATYSATTAGSYTVEVTNGGNCKATSSATNVMVNAIPAAPVVTATQTYCQNGTATALSATGTGLLWYTVATGGTGLITAPTPSTATTGATNYYVSQTTTGCESSRAMIAVTVNALPVATITAGSSTSIPQGGSVVLTASTGSSYKWFNGTAQVGTDANYTATTPGAYSVQITNANNCSATSSATNVNLNSNQPSVITITSPTNSSTVQGAITITVTATNPSGSITKVEYLDGNTVIGTSTSAPYSFVWNTPTVGNHDITVRVTDSNGGITTSAPITVTSEATATGLFSSNSNSLNGVVYPNPANGVVFIDSDSDLSDASFMLVDVLGNEHDISHTGTGLGAQIDVRNLSAGTYVLIIKKDSSVMRKKITVIF
jgi:O-glycosyl hydrolase